MRPTVLLAGLAGLAAALAAQLDWAFDLSLVAVRDRPPALLAGELGPGRTARQVIDRPVGRVERVEFAIKAPATVGAPLGRLRIFGHADSIVELEGRVVRGPYRETPHVRFDVGDLFTGYDGPLTMVLDDDGTGPPLIPHLRPRGSVGARWDFVRAPLGSGEHWRAVRCDFDRWSGIALPIATSTAGAAPITLEVHALPLETTGVPGHRQPALSELGLEGQPTEPPLRRVVIDRAPELRAGHLPIRFEPIEGSRHRLFALRLVLPDGVQSVGGEDGSGFGFVTLHGDPFGDDVGRTEVGGVELPGSDLHVWVWYDAPK